ncbi:MAG TPA: pyrroline-5-carboxylate reductase [Dehalococcoidia bacterium]|nr:pyrroline-5-carboxylate reductase [Dehalococcoidia bacterium]
MKVAFIGVGNMGEAMLSALLRRKLIRPNSIWACDIDNARLAYIEKKYKVNCAPDISNAIGDCEVVVLAIKPQTLAKVMKDLKGELKEEQLVLSIVAGKKIAAIKKGLGHSMVVRVMPNTPAQVGEGMSVWTATDAVSKKQKDMAQTILRAMGKELYVPDEKYIDMATAVSGSGPAYIFLIMEALTDAAVHIGLPREMADDLVSQTVLGSAHMTKETGRHPAELKNMVTSPGGTTAEGLLCLEEGGMRAIIAQAVIAAYEKAKLLGE